MYFTNRYNWIRTTISSIGYLVCLIFQTLIGSGVLFSTFPNAFSLNGIFGVISFTFILFIVIGSNGNHVYVAIILQGINIILMLVPVIIMGSFISLPSIILSIVSIFISLVLSKYLKKIAYNEKYIDNIYYIDSFTGLLNKQGLLRELSIKSNLGKEFYLVMIDLNEFRRINDIKNQSEGDLILKELVGDWKNIPKSFTMSYLGGGTFAIVAECSRAYMDEIIKELFNVVLNICSTHSVLISIAIGISHHTLDTACIDQLITYAEAAMLQSKEVGRNKYTYFDSDSYKKITHRYLTERDIRNALSNDTFEILYQPQFSITGRKIVGYESLLRMRNKDGEFVNTQEFINVAEKSGLIYDIDIWVIKNVLSQMSDYIKKNPDIEISINVSGKHITIPGFVEYIVRCLDYSDFCPLNLKIEITESSYIKDFDEAIKVLNRLKSMGIKIALDDFGAGYSSLSYLARLPTDTLKIDKYFIDDMEVDQGKCNFVDIIIKLGHIMNNSVIAEGVEKTEQLTLLSFLGCDFIQGFVWGKPMTLLEIEKLEDGFESIE